jgi:soluble lytic murein transglycosylase
VLESDDSFGPAADAYRRLIRDYGTSPEVGEARLRLGLASLLAGDAQAATAAWSELIDSDAPPEWRALGLLWRGKQRASAGQADLARADWQAAVDLAPTQYGGLRARGLLDGNTGLRVDSVALDPARIMPNPAELAELDAWMKAQGAGLDVVQAELSANPALARLDELLAIGGKLQASWEADDLADHLSGDPARLAGIAIALQRRGMANLALKQAQAALEAAKQTSRQAPTALQKALYPLPYADLLAADGDKYGVNPLTFAALVRQESLFEPTARSSAGALGLTQVMPATGEGIARALGRSGFQTDDLYRPSVSLEFGAFYFGQRLKRFGGALFPSLAAYNAGDGAVDRWLAAYGATDMDLFAERVPYGETAQYLKIIYENYGLYRSLYGAQ